MIKENNSLKELTIENMNIEFSGVTEIKQVCESKPTPVLLKVNGNFL